MVMVHYAQELMKHFKSRPVLRFLEDLRLDLPVN